MANWDMANWKKKAALILMALLLSPSAVADKGKGYVLVTGKTTTDCSCDNKAKPTCTCQRRYVPLAEECEDGFDRTMDLKVSGFSAYRGSQGFPVGQIKNDVTDENGNYQIDTEMHSYKSTQGFVSLSYKVLCIAP